MNEDKEEIRKKLVSKNKNYQKKYRKDFAQHLKGQHSRIAILACADSRVVPEFIFGADIGDLFVVRVAGNIAVDKTVITSLEYAVENLPIQKLIILGHTQCGAVKAAEKNANSQNLLIKEIRKSFSLDESNHVQANLLHQLKQLPHRSDVIRKAISKGKVELLGAIYHLQNGEVKFL
ncbi:MAG: carbonic anhydrase [Candidatus Cloacimonetes bacterium]|nr:carbonic anhydrase [Candidatus Cloacimonadota bacterium]MBS3767105.1 carbonic anhydrase [Candidatus Cloacimonadota bacterium]